MNKHTLPLLLTILLLPAQVVQADCLDCWVNPKTGKLEPFGEENQARQRASQSRNPIVYGSTTCTLTMGLLRKLKQDKVAYQFKNIDEAATNREFWQILNQAGIKGSIDLPVVYIRGRVLVRPSVQQIQSIQSSR